MTIPFGGYKYQTDMSKITPGELGVNPAGKLVTKDPASGNIVVLGNPDNSTSVPSLTKTYVEEQMDISSLQTLGTNFIFLNGTSFDSMGLGTYEFEEPGGVVYGLYGRTDGIAQQVYYSAAFNNTQGMQYTTVPYVPPFLNGSNWQAQCVCGSDLLGFTLQLRDTTPGSTAAPRYIYVVHNASLINNAGHQYVEITPVVNGYLGSVAHTAGGVPRIIRVGAYFFIALADWQRGSMWFGGWNSQDSTYPVTSAALPASPSAYTPTQFTITTNGLPGGDYTSPTNFPVLFGSQTPGGNGIWRLYNLDSGQISSPTGVNSPEPLIAGWSTNMGCLLEGETDGSGAPYLALGSITAPYDSNNNNAFQYAVFSIQVAFTAGSPGAYTNAQLNYATPSTPGADLLHMQPAAPYFVSYGTTTNPNYTAPNESVASNAGTPTTCVNKLPICEFFVGQAYWGSASPVFSWYYSGVTALSSSGNSVVVRGVTKPAGAQGGSYAAAKANKLANLYPMFNVNLRADFNPVTGKVMSNSFTQPSGQMISTWTGHMIGPDLVLSTALTPTRQTALVVSQLPANSDITNQSYNRNGALIPGFGGRVAEYPVNLTPVVTTHGCTWYTGMSNARFPLNTIFPPLASSGIPAAQMNGAAVRIGNWSLQSGVYQPPPIVWNYDVNIATQVAQVYSTAVANAGSFGNIAQSFFIELIPVMNRAGNGIAFALGVLYGKSSSGTTLYAPYFITPCAVSGNTISLTNTGSVTFIAEPSVSTGGVPGNAGGIPEFPGHVHVVYPTNPTGDWYVGWATAIAVNVAGDAVTLQTFIRFNNAGGVVSNGATIKSISRGYLSCSTQHQGLAVMPYRDGTTVPEVDIPISRFSTSATNTQDDLAASFQAAISNPSNIIPSSDNNSYNLAEMIVLDAINNNFLLQVGSMSGRLNHKQFVLPSSFIDMTSYAVGTYYLYVTDTGSGGVKLTVSASQLPESNTSMFFGQFDRTSTGFANQSSVSEVIRFGTARLVAGSEGKPMQGSQIRIGPYVG